MELDRAEKPLRQLRKLLKQLPANPAPDQVHKLRTRARKIEAIAGAMQQADARETRRLLQSIKPVRKAAGSVRDMDVLAGDLLHISPLGRHQAGDDSLVRLIEHLSITRKKSAGDLLEVVARQRKTARRCLKNYARILASIACGKKPAPLDLARAVASQDGRGSQVSNLAEELRRWPRLTARNIHLFRLKVKELRYVLQLFPDADRHLLDSLGKVKDAIGGWHDWRQLLAIARDVLDPQKDRVLLAQIDATAKSRLTQALADANALRRRHLHATRFRRKAA